MQVTTFIIPMTLFGTSTSQGEFSIDGGERVAHYGKVIKSTVDKREM